MPDQLASIAYNPLVDLICEQIYRSRSRVTYIVYWYDPRGNALNSTRLLADSEDQAVATVLTATPVLTIYNVHPVIRRQTARPDGT